MFEFRHAKSSDVAGIVRLMQNTKYAQYIYPGKTFSELKNLVLDSMKIKKYLVCIDSNKNIHTLVGYFIILPMTWKLSHLPKGLETSKNFAYHAGVGIHSKYRGKGLATKLTKYAFKIAKRLGYKGMYADVGSDNESSIKLQEKCGFKEIARHKSKLRAKGIKNVVFEIRF